MGGAAAKGTDEGDEVVGLVVAEEVRVEEHPAHARHGTRHQFVFFHSVQIEIEAKSDRKSTRLNSSHPV